MVQILQIEGMYPYERRYPLPGTISICRPLHLPTSHPIPQAISVVKKRIRTTPWFVMFSFTCITVIGTPWVEPVNCTNPGNRGFGTAGIPSLRYHFDLSSSALGKRPHSSDYISCEEKDTYNTLICNVLVHLQNSDWNPMGRVCELH
jgi:hypothetical protein